MARQEQVQCDVEVPQVNPVDDQIPMDSEDIGVVNDGEQSVDPKRTLRK